VILSISTKDENISIALYQKNILEKEIIWESYRTQSRELLPEIDRLLKEKNVKLKDINCITVSEGPGSFTGLRVGIAVANALARSLNVPVFGVKRGESALSNAKVVDKKISKKKIIKFSKIVTPFYNSEL
jgi:tRNA threonylcarbamoyladenosine biosynthesis protein TsaB